MKTIIKTFYLAISVSLFLSPLVQAQQPAPAPQQSHRSIFPQILAPLAVCLLAFGISFSPYIKAEEQEKKKQRLQQAQEEFKKNSENLLKEAERTLTLLEAAPKNRQTLVYQINTIQKIRRIRAQQNRNPSFLLSMNDAEFDQYLERHKELERLDHEKNRLFQKKYNNYQGPEKVRIDW